VFLLPSLIGCETSQLASDLWRIRLAMTRLSGKPLDTFLRHRQLELQQVEHGSEANVLTAVGEACEFSRKLLTQLGPAFEQFIAGVSYHRDVNAHNILVELADNSPYYGLVDFGLAVDVLSWHGDGGQEFGSQDRPSRIGQDGASTWHNLDVGGDCRYWPVSAWVQFLLGWTELEAQPVLRSEYRTRLDMHSLGLTALQVLVESMPSLPDAPVWPSFSHGGAPEVAAVHELYKVRAAWERYWSLVSPLHGRLMDTFHNGGDWDVLKADCLEVNVHEAIARSLRAIRLTMIKARSACMRIQATDEGLPGGSFSRQRTVGLMTALLHMIGCGDSTLESADMAGPTEVEVPGPEAWRQVRLALHEGSGGDSAALAVPYGNPQCGIGHWMSPSSASGVNTNGCGTTSERHADLCLSTMRSCAESSTATPVRNKGSTASTSSGFAQEHASQGNSRHAQGALHGAPLKDGPSPLEGNLGEDLTRCEFGKIWDTVNMLKQDLARLTHPAGEKRGGSGIGRSSDGLGDGVLAGQPRAG